MRERHPVFICCALAVAALAAAPVHASLIGAAWDTGELFWIDETTAALTPLANLNLPRLSDLARASDGTIYGLTCSTSTSPGALYEIDIIAGTASKIGDIGLYVYEGGLTFGGDGKLYGGYTGSQFHATLFTIDVTNGKGTALPELVVHTSGEMHDINGMVARSDGQLVAVDRAQSALILIDPQTGVWSTLSTLSFAVGSSGGMTIVDGVAYLATSGGGDYFPGSDSLYSVDLYSGAVTPVGAFSPAFDTTTGIAGLVSPEPVTAMLLASGLLLLGRKRRRR